MRYYTRLSLSALVMAFTLGCSGGTTEAAINTASGAWSGTFNTDFGAPIPLYLSLVEHGDSVSGTGSTGAPGATICTCTVTGTHTDPAIALTLSFGVCGSMAFQGSFTNGTHVSATLSGTAGVTNAAIVMVRQ